MGTTSQKLTYLNDTKTKIRDGINAIGGSLDSDDTFRSYVDELESLYDEMPKVSDTGTNITLDNTRVGKMELTYKGNTQQDSTTGKNKIGLTAYSGTFSTTDLTDMGNCLKVKNSYSGIARTLDITSSTYKATRTNTYDNSQNWQFYGLTPNTQYTISCDISTSKSTGTINLFGNSLAYNTTHTSKTFTTDENGEWSVGLMFYETGQVNGTYIELSNIQLELGSSATSYEPYTNGPSPNPDYPQDIHVVSGDNTIEICGKNLSPNSIATTTDTGYLNTTTGWFGYVKAGETYTLSLTIASDNTSTGNTHVRCYTSQTGGTNQGSVTQFNRINGGGQIIKTFTSEYTGYLMFSGSGMLNSSNVFTNIQLEKGSTATTYEAYKEITQDIDLRGTNIVDVSKSQIGVAWNWDSNTARAVVYTKVKPNTQYTISFDNISHLVGMYDFQKVNKTDTTVTSSASAITSTKTITTEATTNWLGIQFNKIDITLSDIEQVKLMIQEGNTATTFEPYSSIELCKIGDYQDFIYKEAGKWYIEKQVGKVVIDGTTGTFSNPSTNRYNIDNLITDYRKVTGNGDNLSNYYQGYTQTSNNNQFNTLVANENYGFNLSSSSSTIRFKNTDISSTDDFKTWLGTHPTSVYYVLATPTYTEITDTTLLGQLEALKLSYDGQTNVSQSNNDLPFILDVSALKEWE